MDMFTSNGAAVMFGKGNSVAKLLKNLVPHVIEQHLRSSPRRSGNRRCVVKNIPYFEILVTTVYSVFSRSSVKKQGLQAIAQASGHNLIFFKAIHDMRWLSRHFAIQALVFMI